MTMHSDDLPQVIIFPPLIPLSTLVASVLLQLLIPLFIFAQLSAYFRICMGAALLAAGIALMVSGRRALTRNGTNVPPSLPTLVLVRSGIYRWTRNPLYVGGCSVMLAAAFSFRLDWLPLIFPISVAVLHFGIIKREERYLKRKFGADYVSYAARVPRYLPLPAMLRGRAWT